MKPFLLLLALGTICTLKALEVDVVYQGAVTEAELSQLTPQQQEGGAFHLWRIEDDTCLLHTLKQDFTVNQVRQWEYLSTRSPNNPDLAKIIVWNNRLHPDVLSKLPKEKLVLFIMEPEFYPQEVYANYSRVYTWDDTLVDNVHFFKFYYSYLESMRESTIPFADKRLCCMTVRNWVKHRVEALRFFDKSQPSKLDCYGEPPPGLKSASIWRGFIPGTCRRNDEQIAVLSKYRFCLCYENTIGLQGYITEKIFSCFTAGCVPVYWGAANIEKYIPKNCYVDRRDFANTASVYKFLASMTEERHKAYITAIKNFLSSREAQVFSQAHFDATMYDAATTPGTPFIYGF